VPSVGDVVKISMSVDAGHGEKGGGCCWTCVVVIMGFSGV
jgi:hypothetical protein